jgi:hypothetical protein
MALVLIALQMDWDKWLDGITTAATVETAIFEQTPT